MMVWLAERHLLPGYSVPFAKASGRQAPDVRQDFPESLEFRARRVGLPVCADGG